MASVFQWVIKDCDASFILSRIGPFSLSGLIRKKITPFIDTDNDPDTEVGEDGLPGENAAVASNR